MGVPQSSDSTAVTTAHRDPVVPTAWHAAPHQSSFVGTLLHAHRCHQCGDVKLPRPFQTTCGTKAQRTCGACNRQVCVDCYKKAVASDGARRETRMLCRDCRSKHKHVERKRPSSILLRDLMKQLHSPGGPSSLWSLICDYAYGTERSNRQRGGRQLFRAWCTQWTSVAAPMLLPVASAASARVNVNARSPLPPKRVQELRGATDMPSSTTTPLKECRVLADDVPSPDDDGSPLARIPDFSAALAETSGSIFCALNVNTSSSTCTAEPMATHMKPTTRAAPRKSMVSQSPFTVKGSARRPVTCGIPSTSPVPNPRGSNGQAKKDFLGVPHGTAGAMQSPRPRCQDASSSPLYLRPTSVSQRRSSVVCPSVSPMVARRAGTTLLAASTPRPHHPQQIPSPALFGRTDTSTVSPLLFRAPPKHRGVDENGVAQELFR